jgi:hypothetical protein
MSAADRVYRLLLRAYPAEFRAAYEREMAQLFRDRRREASAGGVRFWAWLIWDMARSAPALRLEMLRVRPDGNIQIEGGTMKTMAILAILIGAMEAVNSVAEAWAGGIMLHGGYSLAGGAMGAVAGALLAASAIALLRRAPGAATLAQGAAIACLTVFVPIALLRPMFSIAATGLGIGFPMALLVFLRWTRRRGPSVPTMA